MMMPPTSKRTHIRKSTLFSTDEDDDSNLSYDPAEENGDDYLDDDKYKNDDDNLDANLVDADDDPDYYDYDY